MIKLDNANFKVSPGETVTIEVTAIKVGELVTLAFDGQELKSSSTGPKRFNFTASAMTGTLHFGRMSFTFPSGTAPDALYSYIVSGSAGGSFKGLDVPASELLPARTINLTVN